MFQGLLKVIFPLVWLAYLLIVHLTMGLRPEHFALVGALLLCFFAHQKLRKWALAFFPFVAFGVIYDALRMVPIAWRGTINIQAPYEMESSLLQWFGFPAQFMLGDFFQEHHVFALDVLAACTYSLHIVIPILFALWLWIRNSEYFTSFTWAFLAMNLAAFAIYILYPTAPPWYVTQYGFEQVGWNLIGDSAGLSYFDAWIGFPYFQNTYARAAWNYGAIPSMHAAFPLLVSLFARHTLSWVRWLCYIFTVLVAFSAVYLNHHYVIDLLIGWSFALAIYLIFITVPERIRSQKPIMAPESLEEAPDGSSSV